MANEDIVYAFEKNFTAALQSILTVVGAQTVAFGETTIHQTPRIQCRFDYGGADQIDRGLTAEGAQYLRTHNGTIVLTVYGTDQAAHLSLVGKVRNFMAWNAPTLIEPALAYYQVQNVFEQGGSNAAGDPEGDFEIETELTFDVRFFIPPQAFIDAIVDTANGNRLFLRDGNSLDRPRYTLQGGTTGEDSILWKFQGSLAWNYVIGNVTQSTSSDDVETPLEVSEWETEQGNEPSLRRARVSDF